MATDAGTDADGSSPLNWTEKYRPTTLGDVQGHPTDLQRIEQWAREWEPGDEPLLLVGPPGVGKTATVQALANDMGWSVTEINASSKRTKADIEAIAQQIAVAPIEGRELLFLDEADSLGGLSIQPLLDQLADPPAPIILAANKEWEVPSAITSRAQQIDFSLSKSSIKVTLDEICAAEGLDLSSRQIGKLATRGNLRAAINDLQQYAETGTLDWDQRRTETDNFEVVDNVLRGKRYTGQMRPPELVQWLTENLSDEFRGLEAAVAYDALSRADRWLGRVQESNTYGWWRYAGRLADQTAELRLTEPYDGYLSKSYPQHFRESTTQASDDTPTAQLYRVLKETDTGAYGFAGNYVEFRRVILPLLQDLDGSERAQLAVEYGLHPDDPALDALELDSVVYEQWLHEEIADDEADDQALLDAW